MYMTFRNMRVQDASRMPDAIGMLQYIVERLNSEHGGNFAASMNVGGDPSALALASPWATLGAYEAARASLAADDELASAIRLATGMVTDVQDAIAKIIKPPGDRQNYATVNTVMMQLTAVTEAVPMALEVAEHVEQVSGNALGVLTAVTGNRAGLMWLGHSASMDDLADQADKLEADADYMAFFKRSETVFVPGTLEQSIWQML